MAAGRKILFSDLDGTLLDDEKKIAGNVQAAIDEMLAQGHIFAACTGRPLKSARAVAEKLGVYNRKGCYIVAYNGCVVYDTFQNKIVFHVTVPMSAIRRIFRETEAAGLYIHTYDRDDTVLTYRQCPELEDYVSHTGLPFQTGPDILERLTDEPKKVIVISLEGQEVLQEFREKNAHWTEKVLNSFFSCEQYLEYCPLGVSKATGVRKLCDYLDIPLEASVAAGDERNDITMLEAAGIGAVPANAYPSVRECADYVCTKSNNEGAVEEIIRKFILQ